MTKPSRRIKVGGLAYLLNDVSGVVRVKAVVSKTRGHRTYRVTKDGEEYTVPQGLLTAGKCMGYIRVQLAEQPVHGFVNGGHGDGPSRRVWFNSADNSEIMTFEYHPDDNTWWENPLIWKSLTPAKGRCQACGTVHDVYTLFTDPLSDGRRFKWKLCNRCKVDLEIPLNDTKEDKRL